MKESQYRFRVWDDFWKEMHYFDFCTNCGAKMEVKP